MRVGIPIGEFHPGNTGEYAARAFTSLGHEAQILTPDEFSAALASDRFELYLCVDSGVPIDISRVSHLPLSRVGYWFIDYRHHKESTTRLPADAENAYTLDQCGGWIFQSQIEDVADSNARGITRCSWLPLGADPEVWSDLPAQQKTYDIGFVGNVWDHGRARALEMLLRTPGIRLAFKGHGGAWKEDGAALLRTCRIGFNINSWYGTSHAFDVNMRVFETLSCGVPLLTNSVPSLRRFFPENTPYIREFSSLEDLPRALQSALHDDVFLSSGAEARRFILEKATYEIRMREVIETLSASAGPR